MTDLPPPPGFEGYEKEEWGSFTYDRACTPEEAELLEANEAASIAEDRSQQERLRDSWFGTLRAESRARMAHQAGPGANKPRSLPRQ